ncbi:ATP-binding protein [Kitasatospora sp. NPDC056076]|uniref:ATP-binding protein n=1 Tax=Kitasatospora sp. NPDC056076 TaxID=3345703 RepID=UPI0035D9277C
MTTTTAPTRRARPADPAAGYARATVLFRQVPSQIPQLRSFAASFILHTRPGRPAHLADVLLVVTELATNVVRHTEGPGRLTLTSCADGTEITVSDSSRQLPVVHPLGCDGLSGRGLVLVAALCSRLHVTLDPGAGKTVRARLPDRSPAAQEIPWPDGRTRNW